MNEKKLTPKRRFAKYIGEWEQCKLKDTAEFNPKSILPEEFKYVDLEAVVGTELMGYKVVSKKSAPSRAQRLAAQGDLFYQTVRPYQKNNFLFALKENDYVFSTGYAQMRPSIDSHFLLNRVQEASFIAKVLDRCTGTSYPSINSNDLADIEIKIPENKLEQQKIGEFFKQLDQMITLEQRKLEKTKALKSAYLAEMFPAEGERVPKRRFAGFNDEWKQQTLNKVADYRSGKAHERNVVDNGEYIIVNSKFVSTNGRTKKFSNIQIEPLKKGELAFVLSDIPNGKALAKTFLIDKDNLFTLNQRIAGITPKEKTDSYFLKELMNRHEYFLKFDGGVGQTNLSNADLENFESSYPSFEEQKRIGNFFKKLDDKIITQQQKLEKLKAMKQAYLQEMFV